jgi:hypothetical protein
MSDVLDRETRNALLVAVHKAIVASFDEGDWRSLGFQTDTLKWVERHPRLLRGVNWKNEDYPGHALTAVTMMLDRDLTNLGVMLENPKIRGWLRQNEPTLYADFFDDEASMDAVPPADHAATIHAFLWRRAADVTRTKGFRKQGHDDLLALLRQKAEEQLTGRPRVAILQSLQDAGCDRLIEWGVGAKYGVQLKSHHDISTPDFAGKTVAQIQDSRQHGLSGLYLLLAGDMTDVSQAQKVHGFTARVSRMKDKYFLVISPEQLWTLLFGEEADQV